MTNEELRTILEKHYLWLNGEEGGEKADLSYADLKGVNLEGVNLKDVNLRGVDLRGANLNYANLSETNLSEAEGILSAIDYMATNFERTDEGYIAYKTFGEVYKVPNTWKIETGSVISENVNPDRCCQYGSGINVAPLENVKSNYQGKIWKVLIRWEWLPGVIVPYHTNGKVRCERVELLGVIE